MAGVLIDKKSRADKIMMGIARLSKEIRRGASDD